MMKLNSKGRLPMPKVTHVIPLSNYRLLLTFATGEVKIYDASWVLTHPMTTKLKNVVFFNKARVKDGTVVWNKQLDLGPDDLYDNSVIVKDAQGEDLMVG